MMAPIYRSRLRNGTTFKVEWFESSGQRQLKSPPHDEAVNEAKPGMLYIHRVKGEPQVWLRQVIGKGMGWTRIDEGYPFLAEGGIRYFAFTKVGGDPTWLKQTSPEYRRFLHRMKT